MRSDRDTLDSAGEVGQPPVLFCCSLLMVRGSFLRPYGRIVGACTWQARCDYVSITYTNICACFPASPVMYDGYAIIPNGRPTWAPLLAANC